METQCQHLTMTQRNELITLLQIFEELQNGTLGICKPDPVDSELKDNVKKICSQKYPVTKLHE